jgi:hypothetical protein
VRHLAKSFHLGKTFFTPDSDIADLAHAAVVSHQQFGTVTRPDQLWEAASARQRSTVLDPPSRETETADVRITAISNLLFVPTKSREKTGRVPPARAV